ncbi:MAG: SWIM zinc finger family protein [Magnetococcales bacterium]|nr:SWIM zinc finger family protein [Magnetococcales bacterium]
MQTFTFTIQGSAKDPYRIMIQKDGNRLRAWCTCPAGENGQYCKHRFQILVEGKSDGIVSDNIEDLKIASNLLSGSDLESAINDFFAVEEQENKLIAISKRRISEAKRKVAMVMISRL